LIINNWYNKKKTKQLINKNKIIFFLKKKKNKNFNYLPRFKSLIYK